MPTVLRRGGFNVLIRLPPREHGPPHVHVVRGDCECEFWIDPAAVRVKAVHRMRYTEVAQAFRLVADELDFLLAEWRRFHGSEDPNQD